MVRVRVDPELTLGKQSGSDARPPHTFMSRGYFIVANLPIGMFICGGRQAEMLDYIQTWAEILHRL